MVITLENGQTVTIYEDHPLIRQLEPYIDKEIYELLSNKYGFTDKPMQGVNMTVVKSGDELIGETIRYCNIVHYADLDDIIIATNEGKVMVSNIESGDEYGSAIANCYNKDYIEHKLVKHKDFREEMINNGIVEKGYVNMLIQEDEARIKRNQKKELDRKYEEYLKLKKEFEKESD